MPNANFESRQPAEAMREIYVTPTEMLHVAEAAQDCVDTALRYDWAVISDRSIYSGIPHRNGQRHPDFRLALKDSTFSSLDIDLPRKDEDVRIRITAHAQDFPNRFVVLEEFTKFDKDSPEGFFVNDTHALAFARSGRPVDSYMSQSEVANWLYLQAGLTADESHKRVEKESDPVRNACDILSSNATQHFTVRQVKISFSPDLELHGQLVEALDPNNPVAQPLARKYTAWVNNHHSIDGHDVTERLFVEFSPDDQWLASDLSPMSRTTVMIESSHPTYELGKAVVRQALNYEGGGVLDTFHMIQDRLTRLHTTTAW